MVKSGPVVHDPFDMSRRMETSLFWAGAAGPQPPTM